MKAKIANRLLVILEWLFEISFAILAISAFIIASQLLITCGCVLLFTNLFYYTKTYITVSAILSLVGGIALFIVGGIITKRYLDEL